MLPSRTLGSTGLAVTRMGLGLAALGRPGYINLGHAADLEGEYAVEAMATHTADVLDTAWAGGVRYFDAARSYGRAEEFLARWLRARGIPPEACVVASKWGYIYVANWQVEAERHEVKDHSLATFERQLGESLALLGPFLALYQVHSATIESRILEREDVLDAMAAAREAGHIRAIGLTLSGPSSAETLRRAREIERGGRRLFDTVQATWNALEPSLGPLLAESHAAGIGVLIKEALANGRLTARNTEPSFAARRQLLEAQATRLGVSIDQLALAYVLAQPWADCLLSGAATVDHLRSNVGAFDVSLDEQAIRALESLAEPVDRYWQTRAALPWT
ncbi:MAG: aldo/keto reductase [Ardenticatenaceae bacterium]|nr:aldo/keto reductase [Ardenticatenaceae bacterium]HBY97791.1 aldo/keto reductase [Chloroflexota bacterium]